MPSEPNDLMRTLEEWVLAYQPLVFRAAYLITRDRHAAEDVAQETFLRAYRAAPRLHTDADVRAWLYRIAVNTALNELRSRGRRARAVARLETPGVDDPTDERATRSAVADALDRLPDRLRVPVVLRYYLDWPHAEIAKALRVRIGTVKSRLHDARRLLAADDAILTAAGDTR